jgi:hypothetical protein
MAEMKEFALIGAATRRSGHRSLMGQLSSFCQTAFGDASFCPVIISCV